eukprot:CAMPEP_0119116680 /NCGR_PEP_ID=MMETSP1180-20130426/52422_1 /TAXON_ID=3052 ORGANISM="Chlamydomonas cf sp, Strain CCMP681" /NCGR_SAMPLE_ID=MMETSP1180 /ASSEMBLY_ACC=CAM_ASM_000741 /LENGTH=81 /DNA_ID=CAMNT_0007105863 /DNA_START=362 /DNA_END=607 /DNA_ORIENTATION=-
MVLHGPLGLSLQRPHSHVTSSAPSGAAARRVLAQKAITACTSCCAGPIIVWPLPGTVTSCAPSAWPSVSRTSTARLLFMAA